MRWLICAAGEGSRWGAYLGVPKHLLRINDETLLQRTCRLIHAWDQDAQIIILALSDAYKTLGADIVVPNFTDINVHYQTLPIISALEFAGPDRNNMLFGDVYFSEDCIRKIIDTQSKEITFFGRQHASPITLCEYGELWAISFYGNHAQRIRSAYDILLKKFQNKEIWRVKHWELYRHLTGVPLLEHVITHNFVEINDFTEDFDFPIDYDRWLQQMQKIKDIFNVSE